MRIIVTMGCNNKVFASCEVDKSKLSHKKRQYYESSDQTKCGWYSKRGRVSSISFFPWASHPRIAEIFVFTALCFTPRAIQLLLKCFSALLFWTPVWVVTSLNKLMFLLSISFEYSVRHKTDFWRLALAYIFSGVFVTVLPRQVGKTLKTTKTWCI